MKPKLGFIGLGWIGFHRMEKIRDSGVAEIASVYDPSREIREKMNYVVPGAKVADSFEEILSSNVDGVVIATPSALHANQALMALECGKAVFCQKPLGRTANEVRRVVEMAKHADRLLEVDLSYRFTEGMQLVRKLIQEGAIGEVFSSDLVFHNAYGPDKAWFYDRELSGGGCFMDLGVHLVDLALWCQGFPEIERTTGRLYANGKPLVAPDQVEDYAVARLDLVNGATTQVACSWRISAGCDSVIGFTFYGSKGTLALRNVNGSFYDFTVERYRGTSRELLLNPPDEWGGRAAVVWAERLGSGSGFSPEAYSLVRVAEAMDSVYGR